MKHRIILIAIFMSLSFYSLHSQAETLPRPTGKHFVGVTYLSFIDGGRKEIFDSNRESHREVTVKAWYPSDRQSQVSEDDERTNESQSHGVV